MALSLFPLETSTAYKSPPSTLYQWALSGYLTHAEENVHSLAGTVLLGVSLLGIGMFLPLVAGPSAKFLSLIKEAHNCFIGRCYEYAGYKPCRGMNFIQLSIGGIPKKYCLAPNVLQSSGKQCVQVLRTILSCFPFCPRQDSIEFGRGGFEWRPPANTIFLGGWLKISSSCFFT